MEPRASHMLGKYTLPLSYVLALFTGFLRVIDPYKLFACILNSNPCYGHFKQLCLWDFLYMPVFSFDTGKFIFYLYNLWLLISDLVKKGYSAVRILRVSYIFFKYLSLVTDVEIKLSAIYLDVRSGVKSCYIFCPI
jgi:hypothetical protein